MRTEEIQQTFSDSLFGSLHLRQEPGEEVDIVVSSYWAFFQL